MTAAWLEEIRSNAAVCEARRPFTRKPKKTGTISEAACVCLRAIAERAKPDVAIEIGTFIGTSAMVLASVARRVYTCDKDNDVVPTSARIVSYPKTTSTEMLTELAANRVKAGLFFFDGRIQAEDVPLILQMSTPKTVYAFDDYEGREKGVINVQRLWPHLVDYQLEFPAEQVLNLSSRSTIASLWPEGR